MDFNRHAWVLETIKALRAAGSWTGRTHLHKALYLATVGYELELPFEFCLYKYGPYSFDVDGAVAEMLTYGAVEAIPVPDYGVTLVPGKQAGFVVQRAPLSEADTRLLREVCEFVGRRGVAELERLATAAWVHASEGIEGEEVGVSKLRQLKPHIPEKEARDAWHTLSQWLAACKAEHEDTVATAVGTSTA